jgi:hypothetical protein
MKENKKEWVVPELSVLVRSKPEEAVLTACKLSTGWKAGQTPHQVAIGCVWSASKNGTDCTACSITAPS